MKSILTILLVISMAFACSSTKNKMNDKHLEIVSATRQGFVKGMQQPDGKHAGTSYSVIYKMKEGVEILHLFIGDRSIEFEAFVHEEKNYLTTIVFKDITDNFKNTALPIVYEGAGLIQYQYKGKLYYNIIEKFEPKEKIEGQ